MSFYDEIGQFRARRQRSFWKTGNAQLCVDSLCMCIIYSLYLSGRKLVFHLAGNSIESVIGYRLPALKDACGSDGEEY